MAREDPRCRPSSRGGLVSSRSMAAVRAVTIVLAALALGAGVAALAAIAPAPVTGVAQAHPEPGDVDGRIGGDDNCIVMPNPDQSDQELKYTENASPRGLQASTPYRACAASVSTV